ncbi:MAG: GntR family transcriptional regulator [Thermoguttaceae bacterium]
MLIQIDPSSDQPLYEQLTRQMTFLIAQRAYREHELVPSVREVSKSLAVNPNTVVRAYRHLQEQGILVVRRGMGMAVAESGCERAAAVREGIVEQRIQATLGELRQSGLSEPEIRDTFLKLLDDGTTSELAGRPKGQQPKGQQPPAESKGTHGTGENKETRV